MTQVGSIYGQVGNHDEGWWPRVCLSDELPARVCCIAWGSAVMRRRRFHFRSHRMNDVTETIVCSASLHHF